ncbi:TPA: hypothetical protein ACS70C_002134 [Providencia alcalifaciens]
MKYKTKLFKLLLKPIGILLLSLLSIFSSQAKEKDAPFLLVSIDRSENIPYQLMKNGHIIESGKTDYKGQIFTNSHDDNKSESWLIRTSTGVYGAYLPNKSKQGELYAFYSPHTYLDMEEVDNPPSKNNYVAFTFFGKNSSHYESEPYWIYQDKKLIDSGVTAHENNGGVSEILTVPTVINSFKILTCSNTVFSVERKNKSESLYALTNYFDITYDNSGEIKLTESMKQQCQLKKSWQFNMTSTNSEYNQNKPFLSIGIVPYKSGEQRTQIIEAKYEAERISAEKHKNLKEQNYLSGNKRFSGKGGITPTGECPADLTGIFGIPANLPESHIMDIAHEFYFSNKTLAGDAAFKLYSESGVFYRKGMKSGSVSKIVITKGNSSDRGIIDSLMEGKPYCYANIGSDGDNSYVYLMDYTQMSPNSFEELRQYLGRIWGLTPSEDDLKNIHYLYGRTISEPGIGGASFLIPLQRMAQ